MVNRRTLISGGAALSATTWVAPSVLTLDRLAAATGSCIAETPSVSNGAVLIAAPPTIQEGTAGLDSNTNTFVFLEQDSYCLTSPLILNRSTPGSFNGGSNEGTVVPAGTEISSFYVHGDRLDDSGILTGHMTFASATIIGLIYRRTEMTDSSYLRAPGTTYFNAPMEGSDDMTLSSNSVSWSMRFGGALDGIRVIVACA